MEVDFEELAEHIGHDVAIVAYQRDGFIYNISLECNECNEVIVDENNPDL